MMIHYYQTSLLLQALLQTLSLFVMIILTAEFILVFRRKSKTFRITGVGAMLLLNAVINVFLHLDGHINRSGAGLGLPVPYALLLLATVLTAAFAVWILLAETRHRNSISNTSIKEAFDNLPTGVCFFNEAGLPVLCNHAMYRFSFDVCGKDVQYITDLESCLDEEFVPIDGVRKDGKVFVLEDGSAWHLEKRIFTYENSNMYTQYIAADVTQLHENRVMLQQENEQLRRVQADLQRLSANVVAVTREEEILNTKMRVHDEMGRCLVAAQKYLGQDDSEEIPNTLTSSWQKAVSMLKYNNETADEDMLLQIRKTCEYMKIKLFEIGSLPRQENVAYILTCVVRECVTNAARYAEATELYAEFSENEKEAAVTVSNNGKKPESEIVEGGGLSTLRRRVERSGGSMHVQSFPKFELKVTIPKKREGVL